jgi:hypothetical protein
MITSQDRSCWTCFVRRKACDRKRPSCHTCQKLSLTCHGYGDKPDWMRDTDKREKMAADIRKRVKLVTDRERRDRALRSRRTKLENNDSVLGYSSAQPSSLVSSNSAPKAIIKHNPALLGEPPSIDSPLSYTSPCLSSQTKSHQDSNFEHVLLMSYLDDVFPYHFPFYRPSREDGGRAWLFCLLMRNKPLYKAALAIAAVYFLKAPSGFAMSGAYGLSSSDVIGHSEDLYVDALDALQGSIKLLSQKTNEEGLIEGIEVLASIVHLIILEVSVASFSL